MKINEPTTHRAMNSLIIYSMDQMETMIVIISVLIAPLLFYSFTQTLADESTSMTTFCQVRLQTPFDDQTFLRVLSELKQNDFRIGSPIVTSIDTFVYLCEHQLKNGVLRSSLTKKLRKAVGSARGISWICN